VSEQQKESTTVDQANEALQRVMGIEPEPEQSEPAPVAVKEAPVEPSVETTEPTEEVAAPQETGEAPSDDIESLKTRLGEYETRIAEKEKQFEERWKAFHERSTQNEQILRDRYLRKSSTADRALRVLKATRTEQGVPEAEVDTAIRELESTMNPQSASYAPPTYQAPSSFQEDQAIVLNDFLNEKGMTGDEANQFGAWVRTEGTAKLTPMEQAVAQQSIDGFLRIAHGRWQQDLTEASKQTNRTDAVEAVKSVQRTQRQAAKAASSSPTNSPKKQPGTTTRDIDTKKLTQDDVAELMKMAVEQYK